MSRDFVYTLQFGGINHRYKIVKLAHALCVWAFCVYAYEYA